MKLEYQYPGQTVCAYACFLEMTRMCAYWTGINLEGAMGKIAL